MIKKRELRDEELELVNAAIIAKRNAHVIWGFSVGAAVFVDERIYEGCNIESSISGLGICAERCAIDHAILHGNNSIEKIAIVMDNGNCCDPKPCGACLQYINDFAQGEVLVITALVNKENLLSESVEINSINDLLPSPLRSRFSKRRF
ncbi:MAG: cytidine deaminase [Candidatus Bathyarchaeota archaeon]|nr:cytidine deaminase [Candidatus Bathyarchaeota archaeon]